MVPECFDRVRSIHRCLVLRRNIFRNFPVRASETVVGQVGPGQVHQLRQISPGNRRYQRFHGFLAPEYTDTPGLETSCQAFEEMAHHLHIRGRVNVSIDLSTHSKPRQKLNMIDRACIVSVVRLAFVEKVGSTLDPSCKFFFGLAHLNPVQDNRLSLICQFCQGTTSTEAFSPQSRSAPPSLPETS